MTANVPGLSAVGEKLEAPYHRIRHPFDRQLWLELKILIGTGAYGRVYLADDQFSRRYAVKQLPHSNAAVREIELHNLCNGHPNVVYMYGWHQDQHGYWAVFEYCPSGDLFHHITHADGIFSGDISKKEEIVKQGFLQICNGVAWCHSRGVFHRDLKPENVLVWLEKDPDTNVVYPVLKVADFGLATDKRYTKDFGCGSSFYMSPECIGMPSSKPMPYGSAMTDVWSLGILLLNMVTAQNPWKHAHPNENAFMIYQREPKAFLGRMFPISEELQASICWALELNAVKRCTVQEFCRSVLSCERLHQPCTNAVPVACDPITSNKTLQVNTQVAQQNTVTADAVSCREENNIFVKGSVSASNQRAYEWSNQIDEQGDSGFESGDTYVGRNEMPMYNKLNSNICDVNDICAIFNHYYLDDEAFEISEIVPGQQGKSLEASVNHPHIVDKSQTLISANGIKKALFAKRSPLLNQATLKSNDFCCTSITIPNKKCRRNPRHQNPSKSFWRFDAVRDLFVRRQAS